MSTEQEILFEATRDKIIAEFASGGKDAKYLQGLNDALAAMRGVIENGKPRYDRSFLNREEGMISAKYHFNLGQEVMLNEIYDIICSCEEDWNKEFLETGDDIDFGYVLGAGLIKRGLEDGYGNMLKKGE